MRLNLLLYTIMLFLPAAAFCQTNSLGSMYYHNQYIGNPAFAGLENGIELNGVYKKQLGNVEGAPTIQSITAAIGLENDKVGVGLIVYNDKAGLIQRTNAKATYAYHLPLNISNCFLDFGLSLGVSNEAIDFTLVRASLSDQTLINFNDRKLYFDGDFGVVFRNRNLTLQAAIPNLKRFFYNDQQQNMIDQSAYFAACSYKFTMSGVIANLEPKISYTRDKEIEGVIDMGVKLALSDDKLILSGVYHSTKSISIGLGTRLKKQFSVVLMYTSNMARVQSHINSDLEIGLKCNLSKN